MASLTDDSWDWSWVSTLEVDLAHEPALWLRFQPEIPQPRIKRAGELVEVCGPSARSMLRTLRGLQGPFSVALVSSASGARASVLHAARRLGVQRFVLIQPACQLVESNFRGSVLVASTARARVLLEEQETFRRLNTRLGFPIAPIPSERAARRLLEEVVSIPPTPPRRPDPTRILHLIGTLGPGGAERQLVYLAGHSVAQGQELNVLTQHESSGSAAHHRPALERLGAKLGDLEGPEDWEGIKAFPLSIQVLLRSHLSRSHLSRLILQIRAYRPDVLHAWMDRSACMALVAGILCGVPRIVVSLRSQGPGVISELEFPGLLETYRRLLSRPEVVVLNNSESGRRGYASWIGPTAPPIHVIRNGFPLKDWPLPDPAEREAARRELGIAPEARVLLGVLRLSEEKRPFDFLGVAARLAETHPEAVVVHAGVGPMQREFLERAEPLGVRALGRREDVRRLYVAADVVLLCSRSESCPNVLLEAQALGRPVVTTDAGGAGEAIESGSSGWLVPVGDVEAMASAIGRLLEDPELCEAAGVRGRAFVGERFSLEGMAEETLALYPR